MLKAEFLLVLYTLFILSPMQGRHSTLGEGGLLMRPLAWQSQGTGPWVRRGRLFSSPSCSRTKPALNPEQQSPCFTYRNWSSSTASPVSSAGARKHTPIVICRPKLPKLL